MTARIAAAPISWGVIEVPDWGLQLPAERVLGEMSDLGIAATEFGPAGFLPDEPERRAAALEAAGFRAVGGFVPAILHRDDVDPLPTIRRELEAYAAAGADTLVLAAVTGAEGYDAAVELGHEEWATLLRHLDRIDAAARERDVTATIHPHLGTLIERPADVERVVDGSAIGLCLDTGHFALAGGDPAAFAAAHAERIAHLHLKDVSLEVAARFRSGELGYRDAVRAGMYRALGEGDAAIGAVLAELLGEGYAGWIVLEQDTVVEDEEDARRAVEDARRSIGFVRAVLASSGRSS